MPFAVLLKQMSISHTYNGGVHKVAGGFWQHVHYKQSLQTNKSLIQELCGLDCSGFTVTAEEDASLCRITKQMPIFSFHIKMWYMAHSFRCQTNNRKFLE